MNINIEYAGDAYFARGHHDDDAFRDAMLTEGFIVMDQPCREWWRWGFGGEDGGMVAYGYHKPGRGCFPVTMTEWCISTLRENEPTRFSPKLGKHNYEHALAELNRLVALNPDADTPDGRRLQALAALIKQYEEFYPPTTGAEEETAS